MVIVEVVIEIKLYTRGNTIAKPHHSQRGIQNINVHVQSQLQNLEEHEEEHLPPITMVVHGSSDLLEASNVGTSNEGGEFAFRGGDVLLGSLEAVLEGSLHDILELLVNLLAGPLEALRVLRHLKTGDSDTTGIGSFSRAIPDSVAAVLPAVSLKDVDGFLGAAHVAAFGNELASSINERLGLLTGDFILSG